MNPKDIRIVFMGTPEFAVPSLKALVEGGYNVVGVVTTPDRQAGRGLKVHECDVKVAARELGIQTILQPEKLRDEEFLAALRELKPDLGIVIAFRMLPEVVWAMPRFGTFNLHASLLPQYRGAAPINWAIINGDTETGVTTFLLNHEIDKGAIIGQVREQIADNDTVGSLYDRLMTIGADLVIDSVNRIAEGNITPIEQPQSDENLRPAPKIFEVHFEPKKGITECGRVVTDGKKYMGVTCADGIVYIDDIQIAGKKRLKIRELLLGFRSAEAYVFE